MGLTMSVSECMLVLTLFYVVLRVWTFYALWSLTRKS